MQNDLTDAARWAVDQGIADPQRIAIGGANYGGYATLMGLLKEPALFRCGFEFGGMTDLELLYEFAWTDASEDVRRYSKPTLVGDPKTDGTMLKENSPLTHAGELKQPLLIAQGEMDRRVPLDHGKRFYEAAARNDPNVQWVVYAGESNVLTKYADLIDDWRRVGEFLAHSLPPGPAAATAPAAAPAAASQ